MKYKTLEFNDYEFEQTAKVLMIINSSCAKHWKTWEDLDEYMRSNAYRVFRDAPGMFSTAGFVLTAFDTDYDNKRYVRASLMTYCVNQYLKQP